MGPLWLDIRKLPSPRDRTLAEQLRSFDRAAADWRSEAKAELRQHANRYQQQALDVRERLAELEEEGPYARRARELVAGKVQPGVGLDAVLCAFTREQPLALGCSPDGGSERRGARP